MGLQHRQLPIASVQFHPESILTEGGKLILARFVQEVGRYHGEVSTEDRWHQAAHDTGRAWVPTHANGGRP